MLGNWNISSAASDSMWYYDVKFGSMIHFRFCFKSFSRSPLFPARTKPPRSYLLAAATVLTSPVIALSRYPSWFSPSLLLWRQSFLHGSQVPSVPQPLQVFQSRMHQLDEQLQKTKRKKEGWQQWRWKRMLKSSSVRFRSLLLRTYVWHLSHPGTSSRWLSTTTQLA